MLSSSQLSEAAAGRGDLQTHLKGAACLRGACRGHGQMQPELQSQTRGRHLEGFERVLHHPSGQEHIEHLQSCYHGARSTSVAQLCTTRNRSLDFLCWSFNPFMDREAVEKAKRHLTALAGSFVLSHRDPLQGLSEEPSPGSTPWIWEAAPSACVSPAAPSASPVPRVLPCHTTPVAALTAAAFE